MTPDVPVVMYRRRAWLGLGVVLLIAALLRVFLFRGFRGSDDVIYAARALEVATGLWLPSDYNGALRYGVNLPMASAVLLWGRSETVLALWGVVCSLVEIAVVYGYTWRVWGVRSAIFAGLILATLPQAIDSATNMTADAPFAAWLTLSLVLLYFGCQSKRVLLLFGAGLALGFSGWIKPEAALVFGVVFAIIAFAFMPDRRQIIWIFLGAVVVASLNLAMFFWAFNDPFYYVNVFSRMLKAGVSHPTSWQSYDANFYFRLLFIDGRTLWLAPLLAIPGVWWALHQPDAVQQRAGYFTVSWMVLLLLFFSFFVYSLTPFRWIPKQANYALMFAAPISILAGLALARLQQWLAMALMALVCIGGLLLAVLDGYAHHLHAATHKATIRFAQANSSYLVFSSGQTLNLNQVLGLMGQASADNLRPWPDLVARVAGPTASASLSPLILAYYPGWPEGNGKVTHWLQDKSSQCLSLIAQAADQPRALERLTLYLLAGIRSVLPLVIDRQLNFTNTLLHPVPVNFYTVNRTCLTLKNK